MTNKLTKRCDCAGTCQHPWWYRFMLFGRVRRKSTRTANKHLAGRIAHKAYEKALRQGHQLDVPVSPLLSVHIGTYTEWSEQANKSAAKKDPRVLDQLLASVGDRRLSDVTRFQIERWKTVRVKDVQPSTVNRELNIVRGCFSKAVAWGTLGLSPVAGVKPYRVDNVRTRVLSTDEIDVILAALIPDLRLLARVTLESLLRLSEALQMRKDDIGPASVTVVQSKSGKARHVPITTELRTDLLARVHASGFVFGRGLTGQPPTQEATSVAFGRQLRALGFSDVSHHVFRHTGASAMLAAGYSPRVVMDIGGWSSIKMLERYTHPSRPEMQAAVRVLAAHTAVAPVVTWAKTSGRMLKTAKARKSR